jgi:purine-binding chemotaxis protein CheW
MMKIVFSRKVRDMSEKSSEQQFVTFSLGDEVFAVPVAVVREILDHEDAFKIPHGPDYLLGLRDVRGQGVPVIDLRLRLGMTGTVKTSHTRILVMDIPLADRTLAVGVVADKVFEVIPFMHKDIEQAPDIGIRWRSDYIHGVVRREQGFVVIIDLARLFSAEEVALIPAPSKAFATA